MLRGKILIGYGLWEFLSVSPGFSRKDWRETHRTRKVMGLSHPAIDTRDAALFLPFRRSLRYRSNVQVPLVTLVNRFMGRNIGLHGDIPVRPPARAITPSRDRRSTPLMCNLITSLTPYRGTGRTRPCCPRPVPFVRAGLGGRHRRRLVALRSAPGRLRQLLRLDSLSLFRTTRN